jgi:hypothetical protein
MYPYTPNNKEEVQQEFAAVVKWIIDNHQNKETEK